MSWLRRKQKNRRLGNAHVLDVKLRSDQVRASRMRLTAVALGLVFATIFGFFLIWRTGEYTLDRLIYSNDAFAIEQIDVQTDGVIAPEQLRRWAGVKTGDNLMGLDLSRVKRDLEMISMVRSVAVERVLPHTLRLRVMEREPLAQAHLALTRTNGTVDTVTLSLDAEGYVMTPIDPRQRTTPARTNDVTPLIIGISPYELIPGRRLDSAQGRVALQLIAAFEHSPMCGLVDLQTIDVSSPQCLEVRTTQGSRIIFSLDDLDRQLRRWREIHDQGQRFSKIVATLDLSVPNSIPATWADAGPAPQNVAPNKNIQRNPKKNV